jgi:hypothetical protein
MLTDTNVRAKQLFTAAERRRLDPFNQIDWSLDWAGDELYQAPPEKLCLLGTEAWEAMDEHERRVYSRHESSAMHSTGIFFENLAMQTMLRHLGSIPVTDRAHQFLLLEVAEECKHSIAFSEYVRWTGTPNYSPPLGTDSFRATNSLKDRVSGFLLLYLVEELLDALNRGCMSDGRVQPVAKQVARMHVIEEARHVRFAKSYLADLWPHLDEEDAASIRENAGAGAELVCSFLVNDAVFEHLGIVGGGDMARAGAAHRQRVIDDLAPAVSFLRSIGLVDQTATGWVERGLVPG